jgi:hypothetical protein
MAACYKETHPLYGLMTKYIKISTKYRKHNKLIFFATTYIFNVLSSEAGGPSGLPIDPGPLAFCHPRHPIVMPLELVQFCLTILLLFTKLIYIIEVCFKKTAATFPQYHGILHY